MISSIKSRFDPKLVKSAIQFIKFGLIGGFNTVLDFAIFNLLMFLTGRKEGIIVTVFVSISFIVASINSYFWNKLWTFKSKRDEKKDVGEFGKFFAVSLVGLAIHTGVAWLVTQGINSVSLGLDPVIQANIAKAVAVGASMIWNFTGYKFLVFKK